MRGERLTRDATGKSFPTDRAGVYVIRAVNEPYWKIGTSADMGDRIHAIDTSGPFPVEIVFCIYVDSRERYSIEVDLHRALRAWRTSGEWFRIPDEELPAAISRMEGALEKMPIGRGPLFWLIDHTWDFYESAERVQ